MKNRVLITGINIISSLGFNVDQNWENLKNGVSGTDYIWTFDPSAHQTRISAMIKPEFEDYAAAFAKKRLLSQMTRPTRFGYICALEAIAKSGLDFNTLDKERVAGIFGIVNSGNSSIEIKNDPKNRIIKGMSNALPAWLSIHFGIEGPSYSVSCACSSSAYAAGIAFDLIKNGEADVVITGGADSIVNPEEIDGFNELFALSTNNDNPKKASRPFSLDRDGFVPGEGAGILIFESEEHALKRGAKVYAEVAGYALTSESYNIMAPVKDGDGMAKTMNSALKRSGVSANEITYINAHGTSTTLNDLYETMAIKKVFGERAGELCVTSSKSMLGHTIGAAGAIELGITALSISEGVITPTINYDNPDPELDLNYVPNKSIKKEIDAAISNSFAFGGHNASIVLKKYKS